MPTSSVKQSYLETIYEIAGGKRSEFERRICECGNDLDLSMDDEEVQWVLENWEFEE